MIRFILVFVFFVLYLIVGIPVLMLTWVIGRFNRHAQDIICLRLVQLAFRYILFVSGTKMTIIGKENIPKNQPVLYIANHRSYFDILMTYALCPGLTGFVSKDTLAKVPLLRIWMKRLYCLFLDRKDLKKGLQMVLDGIQNMKNGVSMCIFPEGTRGHSLDQTELKPFKEGSLKMAEKTNSPIIPIAITNSSEIWEDQFPRIKPAHVTIEYGKPIYPNEVPKEERKRLGARTREEIIRMMKKNLGYESNEI
ncbi:MAG: 1-acylglycerol-3-phosphate O-acyltransferase [Lachnospiraceae bacterium]